MNKELLDPSCVANEVLLGESVLLGRNCVTVDILCCCGEPVLRSRYSVSRVLFVKRVLPEGSVVLH